MIFISVDFCTDLRIGLTLAKTLNLPTGVIRRAQEVSFGLMSLQEKARRQSESSKVVARRRVLAQVS